MEELNYISKYETDDIRFIFGITNSEDYLLPNEASLFTMNDFEIIYLKNEDRYTMEIELLCLFKDHSEEYKYVLNIFNKFTEYMNKNNLDIDKKLDLYTVFAKGYSMNTEFKSIEDCYAILKILINGYTEKEIKK